MSILAFAKEHSGSTFRMVAVLLSTFPYGCVEKRALKLLFDDATACSATTKKMIDRGLISERSLPRKESSRPYQLIYYTIEVDGLAFLFSALGTELPWLEYLSKHG